MEALNGRRSETSESETSEDVRYAAAGCDRYPKGNRRPTWVVDGGSSASSDFDGKVPPRHHYSRRQDSDQRAGSRHPNGTRDPEMNTKMLSSRAFTPSSP